MNQINLSHFIFCPKHHEASLVVSDIVKFSLSLDPHKHSSFDDLTSRL